jgi:Sec-independent protein translocase protein TatA
MGPLEIVILSLIGLLLLSTGWLFRIVQTLIGVLMNFGRSILANTVEDALKQPKSKKKSKRS